VPEGWEEAMARLEESERVRREGGRDRDREGMKKKKKIS